jgi:hypothetical protein
MSITDKIKGRAEAHEKADRKAEEVANLKRKT